MAPQRFVINEFIDVVLDDDGRTQVYAGGKLFRMCSYILLEVDHNILSDSIDEIITKAPKNAKQLENNKSMISPKTAYWAHCSNIQAWVEHDYDTRLLDSRLSFPLLKELSLLGDKKAARVLQTEFFERLRNATPAIAALILGTCSAMMDADAARLAINIASDGYKHNNPNDCELFRIIPCLEGIALEIVANHPTDYIREAAASHPKTALSSLERLTLDPEGSIRRSVAGNPGASPSLLACLADDTSSPYGQEIRMRVASHPNTPVIILSEMATDPNMYIRSAVVRNPKAPLDLIECLTGDPAECVRAAIARREDIKDSILSLLASDPSLLVRKEVSQNPNITSTTLKILVDDPDNDKNGIREQAVSNPQIPSEVLMRLATDHNVRVRREVALHHNTPVTTIEVLANDPDPSVRARLLRNPNTPHTIIERLIRTDYYENALFLAWNPKVSSAMFEHLANSNDQAVLEHLLDNQSLSPNTRANVEQKLFKMKQPLQREERKNA
ncbi:MAG: hypothetical protein JW839_15615 [Candidatus Lokiarchaeota archaeon]|nr:hypothetical protein [Candidatus Lokiarchaeota archaeon]